MPEAVKKGLLTRCKALRDGSEIVAMPSVCRKMEYICIILPDGQMEGTSTAVQVGAALPFSA